jgi:hypothetical protein
LWKKANILHLVFLIFLINLAWHWDKNVTVVQVFRLVQFCFVVFVAPVSLIAGVLVVLAV